MLIITKANTIIFLSPPPLLTLHLVHFFFTLYGTLIEPRRGVGNNDMQNVLQQGHDGNRVIYEFFVKKPAT